MTIAIPTSRRTTIAWPAWVSRIVPRLGVLAFLVAIGYLVLMPLYRLQQIAFEDGAAGYQAAFDAPNIADTIKATVGLALGSLAIALVLGTLLAWANTICAVGIAPPNVSPAA